MSSVLEVLDQVKEQKPIQWIGFPENTLYLRVRDEGELPEFSFEESFFKELSTFAKRHQVVIHLGSVPLKRGSQFYNATLSINEKGEMDFPYCKIHLFDVDVEGSRPTRESALFQHGDQPSVVHVGGWSAGLAICYDLRFSELFYEYAVREVDMISVPSAFLVPTGRAHWEVLLRARAIESQCYLLAAAQAGVHRGVQGGQRESYGHTMVVDPWGRVLESLTHEPGVLRVELDRNKIVETRRQIPMKSHRRLKERARRGHL